MHIHTGEPSLLPSITTTRTAPADAAYTSSAGGGGGSDGDGGGKTPGETLQEWSSLIGIVTAIVGNVLIALALNVQRYAHTRLHKQQAYVRRRARIAAKRANSNLQSGSYGTTGTRNGNGHNGATSNGEDRFEDTHESDPLTSSYISTSSTDVDFDDEHKATSNYLKSPYWWLGQVLITLGETGNFLAYGFAPASIVSPLGVVALVSNCLIAPLMFHEHLRLRDFLGVIVAVGGVVTVVLSANTEETKLNPDDVWGAISSIEFEVYLGCTVALIIILMWASPKFGKRTILIDLGLVGLFGGYTALATKGVSSMLSSTLWRAFTTPVTYVLAFILLATAIMQIRYVNKALQRFDSTQVIPIQFVMFTLCVILGSAVLYRDFEKYSAEQAGKFVGGCLLTFFGVFLITSGREPQDDEDDHMLDDDGAEETIGLEQHDVNNQQRRPSQAVPQSRRSSRHSRVSFADTTRPHSPDTMEDPTWQAEETISMPSSLGPESAPLLGRPWDEADVAPRTPPPRGIRTLSADLIMRGSAVARTPHGEGQGPPMYPTDRPITPVTPQRSQTGRPGYHGPRTGTFINPSPLSSTVSTVMKDGFLGGSRDTVNRKSSVQRLRSSIRASLFYGDDHDGSRRNPVQTSEDSYLRGGNDPRLPISEASIEYQGAGRRRSRSVSESLGDMLRPSRKKRRDDTHEGEGLDT